MSKMVDGKTPPMVGSALFWDPVLECVSVEE